VFTDLLSKIASAFRKSGIPYLVIGGQAVLLYGEPRLTQDADILIGLAPENSSQVENALRELGLTIPLEDPAEFVRENMVLPAVSKDTGVRLELIFSSAPFEQQAIKNAKAVTIKNVPVDFASLNDLIIYKIVAGRPRDIEDAEKLIARNLDEVRTSHIRKWLALFDEESGERFEETFNTVYGNATKTG